MEVCSVCQRGIPDNAPAFILGDGVACGACKAASGGVPSRPNIIQRYGRWCGRRSVIFQIVLVLWTALMALVMVGWVGLAYAASRPPSEAEIERMPAGERADYLNRQVDAELYPSEMKAGEMMGVLAPLACMGATWGIVALPLFMGAVFSLDRGKGR